MSTLAEIYALLQQETSRSEETTARVQRDLTAHRQGNRVNAERAGLDRNLTQRDKEHLREVFEALTGSSYSLEAEDLVRTAESLWGIKLQPEAANKSLQEFSKLFNGAVPPTASLDFADFVQWWTYSRSTTVVSLRAAHTVSKAKKLWDKTKASASSTYGNEDNGSRTEYRPSTKVAVNATVGDVDNSFEPKTSLKGCVLPSSDEVFEDAVRDAIELATGDASANAGDGDRGINLAPAQFAAAATLRLPISANATDADVDECVELFNASAEEFNAQDDFPAAFTLAISRNSEGSYDSAGRSFVITVLVRHSATKLVGKALRKAGMPEGEDESAVLDGMVAKLFDFESRGLIGPGQRFFKRILFGVESDTDVSDVLRYDGVRVLAGAFERLRATASAEVDHATLDLLEMAQLEPLNGELLQQQFSVFVRFFLLGLLQSVTSTLHFESPAKALEWCLDAFVEGEMLAAIEHSADAKDVVIAHEKAEVSRKFLHDVFSATLMTNMRPVDVLLQDGPLEKVFGSVKNQASNVPVIVVCGGSTQQRTQIIRETRANLGGAPTLESQTTADLASGGRGPFIIHAGDTKVKNFIAFSFPSDEYARAARYEGHILITLIDVSSPMEVAKMLALMTRFKNAHSRTACAQRQFVWTYGDDNSSSPTNEASTAASGEGGAASTTLRGLLGKHLEDLQSSEGLLSTRWEGAENGGALPQQYAEVLVTAVEPAETTEGKDRRSSSESDGGSESGGEGPGSGAEIFATLLFAFRKVVTDFTEMHVTTREFTATIQLHNANVIRTIPETREALALARIAANYCREANGDVSPSFLADDQFKRNDSSSASSDSSSEGAAEKKKQVLRALEQDIPESDAESTSGSSATSEKNRQKTQRRADDSASDNEDD
jgi:hypothetical protein